jgi:ketosteroid isomerase-like protein
MTDELSAAQRIEHVIRAYVKALNSADADGIAACFCQDADHYFPAQPTHRSVIRATFLLYARAPRATAMA